MLIWQIKINSRYIQEIAITLRGDSMKNTVIIKGNKYGITIVLDSEVAFSQLLSDLSTKLKNAEEFFDSDKQLAVSFEGRELSNEEMDELLYTIMNHSKLNIQYVMDHNDDVEATYFDIIQKAKSTEEFGTKEYIESNYMNSELENFNDLWSSSNNEYDINLQTSQNPENSGLFYKGTLRSGQSLEAKDSIIVIGDVNPGATITANGNVVIIGSLKGSVYAGQNGNENAFVMALSMSPIRVQIADIVANNTENRRIPKAKKDDAMIATIVNQQIAIERVSKSSIHDMNI